jgi:hypothetical protein
MMLLHSQEIVIVIKACMMPARMASAGSVECARILFPALSILLHGCVYYLVPAGRSNKGLSRPLAVKLACDIHDLFSLCDTDPCDTDPAVNCTGIPVQPTILPISAYVHGKNPTTLRVCFECLRFYL